MPADAVLAAFQRGWSHQWNGASAQGFYIGREHRPYTEVAIVKSVQRDDPRFLEVKCKYFYLYRTTVVILYYYCTKY